MRRVIFAGIVLTAIATAAAAGEADVIAAEATDEGGGRYSFSATLKHADEGWKHYANAWEVVTPDGTVLGTRTLYHPHVDEQPFTRSLSGVAVPPGVREVIIRATDSVHGQGGREFRLKLP